MAKRLILLAFFVWFLPGIVFAQARGAARLQVTVVDPSNSFIPGAEVTIVGTDAATKTVAHPAVTTGDNGIAIIDGLVQGQYSIQAHFEGFDLGLLLNVRIRNGDNKHVVVLPLKKFEDSATVGPDTQSAGSNRQNTTFGRSLSDEELDALSDDSTELSQQLQDLGGPDAIIRVDSFEGQQLPPKSQIKSIHVTRDQFAAETEQPGSVFVDVITQPGIGAVRGGGNFSYRDGSMASKNPFAPTKGPEQLRNFGFNVGGALIKEKSNFSLSVNGRDDYTTPSLNAVLPDGTRTDVLKLKQPVKLLAINTLVDYALTKDQTLRLGYTQVNQRNENAGIGIYDLPERALTQRFNGYQFKFLEAGPIGRRMFINTRLNTYWNTFGTQSAVEAPTIVVQDSFNSGGAQQAGAQRSRNFILASDLDYVHGKNSWRAGVQIAGGWFDSDLRQNYLGTYTFANVDAFLAGTPVLYTRQIGDPLVHYFNAQTGIYIQDDIRFGKSFTLSPGIRYSVQTHVHDYTGFGPRFGATWSPLKSGKTTLRASAGIFNSWLPTFYYEQTLRLDGVHQQEIDLSNPTYPDPGPLGAATPSSKYVLASDFSLQRNLRYSGGIDQTFSPRFRVNVLYNYFHLFAQPRGKNLNAPVDGVRPDPNFGNIIESVTDTEIRRHELYVNANLSLIAPSPTVNAALFNWRRLAVVAGYSFIHARNNSNGAFAVPPTGNIADDWGPGPADMPYRIKVVVTSTQLRNLTVNVNWDGSDGTPYTETTGLDNNQDGILNDRPAGVGLRSLRTAPLSSISGRITYTFMLSGPPAAAPPGQPPIPRYRLSLYVNVNNLTNRPNYIVYSGVQTSPFFMQPTTVQNPRKFDVGMNINF